MIEDVGAEGTIVVNFATGETSRALTINVTGDMLAEFDEGFAVTLSNPTPATNVSRYHCKLPAALSITPQREVRAPLDSALPLRASSSSDSNLEKIIVITNKLMKMIPKAIIIISGWLVMRNAGWKLQSIVAMTVNMANTV